MENIKRFKLLPIGYKSNDWTIISEPIFKVGRYDKVFYMVRCKCGSERESSARTLKNKRSKSCENGPCNHNYVDGLRHLPLAIIWGAMMSRCYNKAAEHYDRYGGRGISVCERWHKLENFLEDIKEIPEGLEIDRINNNGNYEPGNIRFVTHKVNCNNKECSRFLEYGGVKKTVTEWSELRGLGRYKIDSRLKSGWSIGEALGYERKILNFKKYPDLEISEAERALVCP